MAITLKVNPYTDNNGDRQHRGKVYLSEMQFGQNENYPTRIREPRDPEVQKPGFINLLEVTATAPDSLKNDPFSLCLIGHKVFILRRRYTNTDRTLRIWFIAKKINRTLDSVETEDKETLTTGRLILTIETEEETEDSTELAVELANTAP